MPGGGGGRGTFKSAASGKAGSHKYKVDGGGDSAAADLSPKGAPPPPPLDCNGFSHLEWSASVPYNLAEEPDEVRERIGSRSVRLTLHCLILSEDWVAIQ